MQNRADLYVELCLRQLYLRGSDLIVLYLGVLNLIAAYQCQGLEILLGSLNDYLEADGLSRIHPTLYGITDKS